MAKPGVKSPEWSPPVSSLGVTAVPGSSADMRLVVSFGLDAHGADVCVSTSVDVHRVVGSQLR